jgi:hypothetical protein
MFPLIHMCAGGPLGATAAFRRARRDHLTARGATRARPRHLGHVAALFWRPARLRTIRLDAVVGTVDATSDFDACFRPATDRVARRWQSIARGQHEGRPLPPIAAVERPDGFYVIDGRHRVSVARALGQDVIDAWVSPSAALPPGGSRPEP